MSEQVYLNGSWCAPEEAMVNVSDRGFLFADAVYEATPAYGGRFLRLDLHLARLARGLEALHIEFDTRQLQSLHQEILARNGLGNADWAMVYTQITRGAAHRTHAFPKDPVPPTVYAFARQLERPEPARWQAGYSAVTHADSRWLRADLKTTQVLPNVLAQQAAVEAGADDVIFIRDGIALEGSHANLFLVRKGALHTAPLDHRVLPGITRKLVLDLAHKLGVQVVEQDSRESALKDADEVFLCGTTTEIRPIVSIDGASVADGRVGPLTLRLYEAFQAATDAPRAG